MFSRVQVHPERDLDLEHGILNVQNITLSNHAWRLKLRKDLNRAAIHSRRIYKHGANNRYKVSQFVSLTESLSVCIYNFLYLAINYGPIIGLMKKRIKVIE